MLRKRSHFICLSCHDSSDLGYQSFEPNADGVLIDKHTRHPAVLKMSKLPGTPANGGTGTLRCADCHMPSMSPEGAGYDIHSHTFRGEPLPEACLNCHTIQDGNWVREQLKAWAMSQ